MKPNVIKTYRTEHRITLPGTLHGSALKYKSGMDTPPEDGEWLRVFEMYGTHRQFGFGSEITLVFSPESAAAVQKELEEYAGVIMEVVEV